MKTATKMEITPMLAVRDCAAAIDFYTKAFGANEYGKRYEWEGKIGHAEMRIGDAVIMLADEFPEHNASPQTLGGSPVMLHLTVDDTDAWLEDAVAAGAEVVRHPSNEEYGRVCKIRDPFGHVWMFNGPTKA